MTKGLTDRQRKFVDLYAVSRRGDQAAIGAGYSAKWASSAASRLLRQPEIAAAIARRINPPPRQPPPVPVTPLDFLLSIVRDQEARLAQRMQAAIAAAPYCHPKLAPGGKKDAKADAAAKAGTGRFAAAKQPGTVVPLRPRPND